ncbi:FecR domain-containing protein [Chitinophaga arvensicola]|uniref:Ferric-dicitrate binding protein FerR, regulates iron transport through sigma-19 n=1 Tax=Chitinophaga arvensicola TaxID=29529 RepID=A0A1I0RAD0_9BACT|nr:FecR domain-containing protein [Chitinophaga arvensicola]SEW37743.1 ferric-dicitrate binding protein FerR, regulates iron transport through sigma-19 [Chitinophaga arvensicola]
MSIRSHIPVDIELLGKYLSGEASPEEAIAIDNWVADDAENRRLFGEVTAIWERSTPGTGHQLPDKKQALLELQGLLEQSKREKNVPVRKIFPYKSIVAAIGLLLLASGMLYFFFYQEKTPSSASDVVKQTATAISRDTLPDGTVTVLNSYSQLKYSPDFGKKNRELVLNGEAWFDVVPDPQRAFVIHIGDIHIKVLGTAFNVMRDSAKIVAIVKSGTILMYRGGDNITVKAGQKGEYLFNSRHFFVSDTADMNNMSYATRIFSFENTSLGEMVAVLEKAYSTKIIIENKKLENCTMSSSFDNRPLQYILDVISITLNVQWRKEHDTIYINGMACD